ncbi:para-aminobenzoate synthetase component 1 [Microbacterium paludicola]|uniref:Para-aminobenzoate synthetase component 1 n=1 Tax=Microbacterium paludicola TaxID=300019 RepID=A0ABU1HZX6_9MICO|nr:para-aminobenzoate synthetase component 1 [Microbacterium paludicola]
MIVPETTSFRCLDGWIDPADLIGTVPGEHVFWLDAGADADSGWSWLGSGEPADAPDPIVDGSSTCARSGGERVGPFGGGWVGWTGYDAAAARAGAPAQRDADEPDALWLRVDRFVAFDHAERRVWVAAPADAVADFAAEVDRWRTAAAAAAAGVGEPSALPRRLVATARVGPERYAALVEDCRSAIRRGDAYQLCLTTRFTVRDERPIDALGVFRRLRGASSSHHGALFRSGERALISASPERFLGLADGTVLTSPIKGTRGRGGDAASDARLVRDLLTSPKERAENVMIVDLMRNDLQRVSEPGSVVVERLLEVETYPTVHQLVSSVSGSIRPGTRLSEVLAATFPAGSMTGAPKLSAMTILHALERAPRGTYAGCFGWVGHDGDADLAMIIRSIVVDAVNAYVGAGGGITWGSEPDAEVDEVALKAQAPLAALGADLPPRWRERVR